MRLDGDGASSTRAAIAGAALGTGKTVRCLSRSGALHLAARASIVSADGTFNGSLIGTLGGQPIEVRYEPPSEASEGPVSLVGIEGAGSTEPRVQYSQGRLDPSPIAEFFPFVPPPVENFGAESGGDGSNANYDPILIDLGRFGFDLTSPANGVSFDIDASGSPDRVSWTAPRAEDAFLVLDRNGNGLVDDGGELFGNATRLQDGSLAPHGYIALAELDVPANGGNANGYADEAIGATPSFACGQTSTTTASRSV